jgi:hypothetical protein
MADFSLQTLYFLNPGCDSWNLVGAGLACVKRIRRPLYQPISSVSYMYTYILKHKTLNSSYITRAILKDIYITSARYSMIV